MPAAAKGREGVGAVLGVIFERVSVSLAAVNLGQQRTVGVGIGKAVGLYDSACGTDLYRGQHSSRTVCPFVAEGNIASGETDAVQLQEVECLIGRCE